LDGVQDWACQSKRSEDDDEEDAEMATQTYEVTGMTCGHCVRAVSGEIRKIQGVTDVQVDLPSGRVTVTSDGPVEDDAVREAVGEAGYEMAS
jgi:copper chaperone